MIVFVGPDFRSWHKADRLIELEIHYERKSDAGLIVFDAGSCKIEFAEGVPIQT